MKVNSRVITVIAPRLTYDPAERVQKVPITTKQGHLLIKRLRRFLIAQQLRQVSHPEDPMIVEIPGEIMLKIVDERYKMTNSLHRMRGALDRKSQMIGDLRKQLSEQSEIFDETIQNAEFDNLVFGAFADLLDVATEYREAVVKNDSGLIKEKYNELLEQITAGNELMEELRKESEPETAKEEEKNDQC